MSRAEPGVAVRAPGFTEEGFAVLRNWRSGETAWQSEFRQRAWSMCNQLPMPTRRDEEWRRTDLRGLDWNVLAPYAPSPLVGVSSGGLPEDIRHRIADGPASAGVLVQHNSDDVYAELKSDLRKAGVVCSGIDDAARLQTDVFRRHYGTVRPPVIDKFTALHYAFQAGGAFVHVPAGLNIEQPIRSLHHAEASNTGFFPHTLIVLEHDSSATFFEETGGPASGFVSAVTEVRLSPGARLRYVTLQEYGNDMFAFSGNVISAGQDAQIVWLTADIGCRLVKSFVECELIGSGSHAELLGLHSLDGARQTDHVMKLRHRVPRTEGNILYKGVCADESRSAFRGRIIVEPAAKQTQSFLADHSLMLSDRARVDSVPTLEIEAHDVVCKHAATVGEFSMDELFYLQSRGIPADLARTMIVLGFYEAVIQKMPEPDVCDRIRRALRRKFVVAEDGGEDFGHAV